MGPPRGNETANPRDDADRALAAGRFAEALDLYQYAIERDPEDRHSVREAGRAAHALQKFEIAVVYLDRAAHMTDGRDPELYYLLGEAYWVLGRADEAKRAQQRAVNELGAGPHQRIEKLWLARIQGRLGDRTAADVIYDELAAASPGDAEVSLAQAEMRAMAKEWDAAERAVRRLLAQDPKHTRALAIQAWILEARGQVGDELAVRESLREAGDTTDTLRDYGRALERAGNWAGALAAYRKAAKLPDGDKDLELSRALQRVEQRMSNELGAGAFGRTDPNASGLGAFVGLAVPFGRAHHWTLNALHEVAMTGDREVYAGELRGAAVLRRNDAYAIVGGKAGLVTVTADADMMLPSRNLFAPGVFGSVSSGLLGGHAMITVDAEANSIWRETPRAVFEGGRTDGVTTHLYVIGLGQRLVVDTGIQARQLRLTTDQSATPRAKQALGWAGADLLVWSNFGREARGQLLDDDLLRPTFSADSAVLSYRHYELFGDTDPMFATRLSLSDRASIDELSATVRKVLARGVVAVEARGGFGRDWARELYLARGAAALWVSPTPRSRFSFSFELARESVRAFAGERRTGWMNYHVDL